MLTNCLPFLIWHSKLCYFTEIKYLNALSMPVYLFIAYYILPAKTYEYPAIASYSFKTGSSKVGR